MSKLVEEYIENKLQEPTLFFPKRVADAYDSVYGWMTSQPHMHEFTNEEKPDLADPSPYSVAKQFYQYYQTHFSKAYRSLLSLCQESLKRDGTCWLDEPRLCVLDIGSGGGAATMAILEILCDYQEHRWLTGHPVWARELQIVTIEPNKHAQRLLDRCIDSLTENLKDAWINLSIERISEEFPHPNCLEEIKRNWRPSYSEKMLVIFSNVELWMQTSLLRISNFLARMNKPMDLDLGQVEAEAFLELFNHYKVRQFYSLDIVTRGHVTKSEQIIDALLRKIENFVKRFTGGKTDYIIWKSVQTSSNEIKIANAHNTYWGNKRGVGKITHVNYFHKFRGGTSSAISDTSLEKLVQAENLQLAWVRTRNHMYYDDLIDEVEIRLMDYAWSSRLERLKYYLSAKQNGFLDHSFAANYAWPKNGKEDRPRYLLRMGEQIVSAAISQSKQSAFKPFNDQFIFGNRLNTKKTEFFYERWFEHFDKFNNSILNFTITHQNAVVIKLDIKSFYTQILQNKLYNQVHKELDIDRGSKVREVVREIILRPLVNPPHNSNQGLPQSGVAAGLWSSFYLTPIDEFLLGDEHSSIGYFRYADDITLVTEDEGSEELIEKINDELQSLGLTINPNKTSRVTLTNFRNDAQLDLRFDKLGKKARRLLNSLYHIPISYRRAKVHDRQRFLHDYTLMLKAISIYLPDYNYWLNRKIYQRSSPAHRLAHLFWGHRVKFPTYHLGMSKAEIEHWSRQFYSNNPDWERERKQLETDLVAFYNEGLKNFLDPDNKHKKKSRAMIRFAVYRLATFGIRQVASTVEEHFLRKHPWDLSPKIILKAFVDDGLENQVLELARDWHGRHAPNGDDGAVRECAYSLCAAACRALSHGEYHEEIEGFLWDVLNNPCSHSMELLAASEALLRLQVNIDDQFDTLFSRLEPGEIGNPFLTKNLILLLSTKLTEEVKNLFAGIVRESVHPIVHDAIQFALVNNKYIFDIPEPSIVESYYSTWYPDIPIKAQSSSGIP